MLSKIFMNFKASFIFKSILLTWLISLASPLNEETENHCSIVPGSRNLIDLKSLLGSSIFMSLVLY